MSSRKLDAHAVFLEAPPDLTDCSLRAGANTCLKANLRGYYWVDMRFVRGGITMGPELSDRTLVADEPLCAIMRRVFRLPSAKFDIVALRRRRR